jgi:anti-sigma B factor antagonist
VEGIEFRASSRHLGDGTRVVAVAGEVDLYTAPEFERALELNGSAGGRIVVHLSECTFLDSTGLGIIVQATRHGGSNPFLVVASGLEVLRAFQVTGLDRRFVLHPTLQSALNGGAVSGWSDKEARTGRFSARSTSGSSKSPTASEPTATTGSSANAEGFLAQVLQRRRNHDTFTVHQIEYEARPDLASRCGIKRPPAIVVVEERRVRGRIEQPRGCREIESLLAPCLK